MSGSRKVQALKAKKAMQAAKASPSAMPSSQDSESQAGPAPSTPSRILVPATPSPSVNLPTRPASSSASKNEAMRAKKAKQAARASPSATRDSQASGSQAGPAPSTPPRPNLGVTETPGTPSRGPPLRSKTSWAAVAALTPGTIVPSIVKQTGTANVSLKGKPFKALTDTTVPTLENTAADAMLPSIKKGTSGTVLSSRIQDENSKLGRVEIVGVRVHGVGDGWVRRDQIEINWPASNHSFRANTNTTGPPGETTFQMKSGMVGKITDRRVIKDVDCIWVKVGDQHGWQPIANVDVDYPVGFPARAKHGYMNRTSKLENPYLIEAGELCRILDKTDNGWLYAESQTGDRQGWLPANHLEIGPRQQGNFLIFNEGSGVEPKLKSIPQPGTSRKTPSNLYKALLGLYSGLQTSKAWLDLSWLPENFDALIQDKRQIEEFASTIEKGVDRAGLTAVFKSNTFTAEQIARAGHTISSEDKETGGVYLIWYKFKDRPDEIYVGKTNAFFNRDRGHKLPGQTDKHHEQTYDYIERIMVPICILTEKEANSEKRGFVEQTFVLLLQTYTPLLRSINADVAGAREGARTRSIAYAFTAMIAIQLSAVANETFKTSGWVGGTQRVSFRASKGHNWSSPLTERAQEKLPWSRQIIEKKIAIFRRTPKLLNVTKERTLALYNFTFKPSAVEIGGQKGTSPGIFIFIPLTKDGPQPGDLVYLSAEVRLDGKVHEHAYARLPKLPVFTDWTRIQALAFYAEWFSREKNTWKGGYIQAAKSLTLVEEGVPGALAAYAKTHAFLRYFLQETLPDNAPKWMKQLDLRPARIKAVDYDVFKQEIRIASLTSTGKFSQLADRLTRAELKATMESHGLDFVGVYPCPQAYVTKANTNPVERSQRRRKTCDTCLIAGDKWSCYKATSPGAVDICQNCYDLGRLCSWTYFYVPPGGRDRAEVRNQSWSDVLARGLIYHSWEAIEEVDVLTTEAA